MIHMPRRSVTRFFIPLIDVLLLLFVIFLLMPFVSEEESEAMAARAKFEDQADEIDRLKRQLARQKDELAKLRHLRDPQDEIDRLRAELERVSDELKRLAGARFDQFHRALRIIEVDAATGNLTYFDAANAKEPLLRIDSPKKADALIARLQKETDGKELFLEFYVVGHPASVAPLRRSLLDKKPWFDRVPNSLRIIFEGEKKEKQP
jgi:septal ring factor EnvC (AmiA/AmiB activator)